MVERLLTPADVADRLSVSRSMVYLLIKRGDLPAVYVGRLARVSEESLRLFLTGARASGGALNDRPTTPEHADR